MTERVGKRFDTSIFFNPTRLALAMPSTAKGSLASFTSTERCPLSTTSGCAFSQATCSWSLRGCHASSASRKATYSPRAASQPALRAGPGPPFSGNAITLIQSGVQPARMEFKVESVSSPLASSTRITSSAASDCAATEATARWMVRALLQQGMTTLTLAGSGVLKEAIHHGGEALAHAAEREARIAARAQPPAPDGAEDRLGHRGRVAGVEVLRIVARHLAQHGKLGAGDRRTERHRFKAHPAEALAE